MFRLFCRLWRGARYPAQLGWQLASVGPGHAQGRPRDPRFLARRGSRPRTPT